MRIAARRQQNVDDVNEDVRGNSMFPLSFLPVHHKVPESFVNGRGESECMSCQEVVSRTEAEERCGITKREMPRAASLSLGEKRIIRALEFHTHLTGFRKFSRLMKLYKTFNIYVYELLLEHN